MGQSSTRWCSGLLEDMRGSKLRRRDDGNKEETGGYICQPLCTGDNCSQEVRHRNTLPRKYRI